MVSAVSSLPNPVPQALNANDTPSSGRGYLVPGDNDSERTAGSAQTDSSRNPIVQISLSEDALRHLANQPLTLPDQSAYLAAHSTTVADQAGISLKDGESLDQAYARYFDDISASIEIRGQIAKLNGVINPQVNAQEALKSRQADYDRISNTKPVPQQELTGKDKDRAFDLLSSLGYAQPGENQTVSFSVDNLTYTFKDDGSVWTNEVGVPTSESAKQLVLNTLNGLISYGQQDISASISQRDALQTQYDALTAKYVPKSAS